MAGRSRSLRQGSYIAAQAFLRIRQELQRIHAHELLVDHAHVAIWMVELAAGRAQHPDLQPYSQHLDPREECPPVRGDVEDESAAVRGEHEVPLAGKG